MCISVFTVSSSGNSAVLISSLLTFGSAVEVTGCLKKSPSRKQPVELLADRINVVGECDTLVNTMYFKESVFISHKTNIVGRHSKNCLDNVCCAIAIGP